MSEKQVPFIGPFYINADAGRMWGFALFGLIAYILYVDIGWASGWSGHLCHASTGPAASLRLFSTTRRLPPNAPPKPARKR